MLLSQLRSEGKWVVKGGDGRAYSPGYLAKLGSYTVMELQKHVVIEVQVEQVGTCDDIILLYNAEACGY